MKRALVASALVLAACSKRHDDARVTDEIARREAFAKALLVDGGADAYRVGPRADVQFGEGFSIVEFDPPDDWRSHAFRWMGQRGSIRLRAHGDRPMRLRVGAWVNEKVIDTRPDVRLRIDGELLRPWPEVVDDKQFFNFDDVVGPELLRGKEWVNLEIEVSSVAWHWAAPPELKVVVLFDLTWEPAAAR